MKATLNGGSGQPQTITMELSIEEAEALMHALGTDSTGNQLDRGVSREQSFLVYRVFSKLDDTVMAARVLKNI